MRLPKYGGAALSAVVAFALIWLATEPPALGFTTDSAQYVAAARSLVADGTLEVPTLSWSRPDSASALKHYPPGMSVAMASAVLLGADIPTAARIVIALSAAIWVGVLVTMVTAVTSPAPALVLATAVLAMPSTVFVHQYVMSEPLYLAALLLTICIMWAHPSRPLAYGIAAALCSLVRYAGLAAIIAAGVWALAQPGTWATRVRRGLLAGLPSLVLQGLWQIRIMQSGQDIAPLTNPGGWTEEFVRTIGSVTRWLAPGIGSYAVRGIVALGFAGLTGWLLWRHRRVLISAAAPGTGARRLCAVTGLVLGCHLAVLLVLRATTYVIPFDLRILAPVFLLIVTLAGIGLALVWPALSLGLRRVTAAVIALWIVSGAVTSEAMVRQARRLGLEYGELSRRSSASIRWIRERGDDHVFFTNAHATLYLNAGRHARSLPLQWTDAEARAFADTVRRWNGLIAIFTYPSGKVPAAQSLIAQLPADSVASFPDAVIWRLREPTSAGRPPADSAR